MLKGNYTTIIISVILHLLLLVALIYSAPEVPTALKASKTEPPAIKSFLYVKPKKSAKPVVTEVNYVKPEEAKLEKKEPTIEKNVATVKNTTPIIGKVKKTKEIAQTQAKPALQKVPPKKTQSQIAKYQKSKPQKAKSPTIATTAPITKFSSFNSLSSLRNKLDQQNRIPEYNEPTTNSSASSMLGEQNLVPETIVPLTQDQQKILNTSSSHFSSITKNGNGTCTIQREQMLGSPVPGTTSMFACGENDFDRNFRLHMQEVQRKLLPNKKK